LYRREFLKALGLGASAAFFPGLADTAGLAGAGPGLSRPNIVYILADDMGYGDVGALNPECRIPTPNMNRLAAEGMVFTDAHSGSAVCTPTRYGILTGRYAWRSRLQSGVLFGYGKPLIPPERKTVASFLREQGYATACVGKWHLGWDWALHPSKEHSDESVGIAGRVDYERPIANGPTTVGFDYFFGIPASLDMVPYVYVENDRIVEAATETIKGVGGQAFYRGGPCAPGFRHEEVLPRCTEKAVAFIDRHCAAEGDEPFFLYFPMSAPHTPILPTKEFQGKSGIGPYGDFVCQCDGAVGRVIDALERNGVASNTLFIVTSDNGCSPTAGFEHLEMEGHDPSHVFRGHKADIYEGGHRIPFVARWPGRVASGSTCDDTICLTDLFATAAEIVEKNLPDDAGEDSVSILPALLGQPESPPREVKAPLREAIVHHSINGSFSIRRGKWKLEFCPGSGGWSDPKPKKALKEGLPLIQLYDLEKDIGEQQSVHDRYPEIVYELTKLLESYVEKGRSTPGEAQQNDVAVDIWKMTKMRGD
jgi:arylsulfatase A